MFPPPAFPQVSGRQLVPLAPVQPLAHTTQNMSPRPVDNNDTSPRSGQLNLAKHSSPYTCWHVDYVALAFVAARDPSLRMFSPCPLPFRIIVAAVHVMA